jgi:hypothetical protein
MSSQESAIPSLSNAIFEISSVPPEGWNAFVERHNGYIFHQSEWMSVLEAGYSNHAVYAFLKAEGEIVAGIAGTTFDFKFFRMFFSNMPYGGYVGESNFFSKLQEELEKALRKLRIHQIRMTQTERFPGYFPADYLSKHAGFQHVVDLSDQTPSSLWEGYRSNNRRDIRKAMKSGIEIETLKSADQLPAYLELYKETMKRNAAPMFYPKKLFLSILSNLHKKEKADILFAKFENKPIAAILLIYSKDTVHLLGSVSSTPYLKYCPNELLLHTAMELTLQKRCRFFVFMMSSNEDTNLIKFKEKWNAKAATFDIYEKDLSVFHCNLWRWSWAIAQSQIGTRILSWIQTL